ncbi:MAG TPA: HEAT repeat domain-containing protein [Planctomycetota bacterium]|nr:HEAT repeat domain-containing protein [Planctomycetota bacterium]
MNDTAKEILGILEAGKPELQVAAAQILGELRPRDPSVCKALAATLGRSHVLGRFALDSLSKLGTAEALRVVARAVWEHEGLADQASHLLTEHGLQAHPALAQAYDEAPVDRRGRILAILGKHLSKDSLSVFEKALFQPDLAEAAARTLLDAAPQFGAEMQKHLRVGITRQMAATPMPASCLVQLLAVLGKVDAHGSRALIQKHTGLPELPEVRSAAFRALAGARLSVTYVKQLLAMLEDPAERLVHEAIRELLSTITDWPDGMGNVLKKLLSARQPEQKLFALRALRSLPSADTARIAIKYFNHPDPAFQQAAADALSTNRAAIEPLLRMLQMERDPSRARRLAALLLRLKPLFAPRLVKAIAERAVKLMGANALAGDLLFDLALGIDGNKVAPLLLERATRLRRSKRFPESLHLLARLASTPHLDHEGRYQLALTRLLHDLARPSSDNGHPGNATMGFFAALVRDDFPLAERLRKESMLGPEALLRLATYFAEAVGPERKFGAELLQHLATRTKGRAGEQAKLALRAVGL